MVEISSLPDYLLQSPCSAVRHGDGSVVQLASAYIENVGCIRKHEIVLEEIILYNNAIKNKNKLVNKER